MWLNAPADQLGPHRRRSLMHVAMDLVTKEKLRGESRRVQRDYKHAEHCESTRMAAADDRCQLV